MRIPIINRFTCNPKQLPTMIQAIKKKQMIPIIDNVNENGKKHVENFKNIKNDIELYPMSTFAIKLSSLNIRDPNNNNNKLMDNLGELGELANVILKLLLMLRRYNNDKTMKFLIC